MSVNRIGNFYGDEDGELNADEKRKVFACILVEEYIASLEICLGEDGAFFAYVAEENDLTELQTNALVEVVENCQSELGGL